MRAPSNLGDLHPHALQRIGNTPLLRLQRAVSEVPGAEIHVKAEWTNPGGSVKDRAAAAIVEAAWRTGSLSRERTLVDATSGNTGISYAMLGSALGFAVQLVVPANVGLERRKLLEVLGAQIVWTDPMQGMDLAIDTARELAAREPHRTFYADQYDNDANWRAHYEGTGAEILAQTGGRLTHFVAGLGTTGTFVGTVRRLRDAGVQARCVAVIPDSPYHGLEGLKHMPTAHVPGIYDPALADEVQEVGTEEAYAMVQHLARHEGLLVGPSGAGAVAVARRLAQRDGPGTYVVVVPDSMMKYLSDPLLSGGDAEGKRTGRDADAEGAEAKTRRGVEGNATEVRR